MLCIFTASVFSSAMFSKNFGNQPPDPGSHFQRRRRVPRYSLRLPVEIFEPIHRSKLTGETLDVSLKGCYVLAPKPVERDFIVQLKIRRKQEMLEVWARVAHNSADRGMGLAFLSTQPAQDGLLERWIKEEGAKEKSGP